MQQSQWNCLFFYHYLIWVNAWLLTILTLFNSERIQKSSSFSDQNSWRILMASANAYNHHMTTYMGIYLNEVSFWSNAFILRIQEDAQKLELWERTRVFHSRVKRSIIKTEWNCIVHLDYLFIILSTFSSIFFFVKVHIFWEGYKILQKINRRFVLCSNGQIYDEDFTKMLWPSQNGI